MSVEREQEFEELLAFLEFHWKYLQRNPVAPPAGLTLRGVVEGIVQEHGRSKALQGTRQAVNDVLEQLADLEPETVALIDETLRAAGLVTLSELRRRYSATYQKILRRGSIKMETEFHLVNGLIVDLASNLATVDRKRLEAMVAAYEC